MTLRKRALAAFLFVFVCPPTIMLVLLQMFGRWLDGVAGTPADRLLAYLEKKHEYIRDRSET